VGSGVNAPLAERWNGGGWAIQATPKPASASLETALEGVSCPTTTDCTAVGFYEPTANAYIPLAERWNGTSWAIQSIPTPSGAGAAVLERVDCTAAGACIAVGWSSYGALIEHWNGAAWSIQAAPHPTGSVLSGISCTTPTACTAVGGYNNTSGETGPLAELYSG
jgi:hypothetical protein